MVCAAGCFCCRCSALLVCVDRLCGCMFNSLLLCCFVILVLRRFGVLGVVLAGGVLGLRMVGACAFC